MGETKVSNLKKKLREKLGKGIESRVMTDIEDRYVYSTKRIFFAGDEEENIPELVIKPRGEDEVRETRRILLKEGFTPVSRDKYLRSEPENPGKIALIDYTEPIYPPVSPNSQTGFASFSNIRLEGSGGTKTLEEKCKEHTICKGYCPIGQTVYGDVETWSPKGRLIISREITSDEESEIEQSKKVSDILFSCAACGNCYRNCTEEIDRMYEGFIEAKKRIIERGQQIPHTIKDALESTLLQGNPYQEPRRKREEWISEIDADISVVEESESVDLLLFVGCSPSYEERNQELAKALAKILVNYLDLEVGVLGKKENCCGSSQRIIGEEGLFEEMVTENSEHISSIEFDNFVTISPHCYDVIKNEYHKYGGADLDPLHYTQFLVRRLNTGDFSEFEENEKTVTYHDPCYLDRHNKVHKEPRDLIKKIPGFEYVDIESTSMCCGGGGGRMWFDDPQVEKRPPEPIIESSLDAGADILAVACPFCLTNFEDSVKTMGVEEKLTVKDISELVASAL